MFEIMFGAREAAIYGNNEQMLAFVGCPVVNKAELGLPQGASATFAGSAPTTERSL